MSTEVVSFEQMIEGIIRKVVREELQAVSQADRVLTAQEVAEQLGYDVHTVYRLRREKKLQGFNLGNNSLRFYQSDVSRFIQERAS